MFSTRRTPTALRTPSGICVHSVEWLPCGRLGVSLADLLLFRWPAAFSAPNLGRLDRIADRRLTHPQRFLQAGQTKPRGRGYWKAATRQHLPGYTGPESPSTRTLGSAGWGWCRRSTREPSLVTVLPCSKYGETRCRTGAPCIPYPNHASVPDSGHSVQGTRPTPHALG